MMERFRTEPTTEDIIKHIETLEAKRDEIQVKIDAFFELLKQRHQEASAECGEVDYENWT